MFFYTVINNITYLFGLLKIFFVFLIYCSLNEPHIPVKLRQHEYLYIIYRFIKESSENKFPIYNV